MEKIDLDKQVLQPEPKTGTSSVKVILIVGLVGVTVALVLLAAIGGVYVNQLQNNCHNNKPAYKEKYQHKSPDGEDEDIEVDREHYIEKIQTKDKDGKITSVAVLNYRTRMITVHDKESKQCYLFGGLNNKIASFDDAVKESLRPVDKNDDEADNATYGVVDEKPVYDTSILTEDLREDCSKGNLYWMERLPRATKPSGSIRQKRGWSCGFGLICRWYWGGRRCYWGFRCTYRWG